jgi:hypothetical protein
MQLTTLSAVSAAAVVGILGSHQAQCASDPAWIGADEAIVILQSPRFYFDWENRRLPLNIDLYRCATKKLHSKYPRVHLIAQSEFVRTAFPDLEPKAAPVSPESMQMLLDNETLRRRIAPLNIRYVVYAGTQNDVETVVSPFLACSGGYGFALCGGGAKWKKRSSYDLVVMDLRRHHDLSAANTTKGTSWFWSILPLFVGWSSPTEARACDGLGGDLLHLFEADAPAARYDPASASQ